MAPKRKRTSTRKRKTTVRRKGRKLQSDVIPYDPSNTYRNAQYLANAARYAYDNRETLIRTGKSIGRGISNQFKRRRTGGPSSTANRFADTINSAGSTVGYTSRSVQYGRRFKLNTKGIRKLVKANRKSVIYGFQVEQQYGANIGLIALNNNPNTGAAGTTCDMPLHMYDLSATINQADNNIITPMVMYYLRYHINNNGNNFSFDNFAPTGLSVYGADNLNLSNYTPGSGDLLEYANIRLLFYAPIQLPTIVRIDLCQLKDERLDPNQILNPPQQPTADDDSFVTGFWSAMVKRYTYSPLAIQQSKYKRYIKFIRTWYVRLDDKTTSTLGSTVMRQINLFIKLNRICRYNQDNGVTYTDPTQNKDEIYQANNTGYVVPRAKMWLMIRGTSGSSPTIDGNKTITYDINYRVKHSELN